MYKQLNPSSSSGKRSLPRRKKKVATPDAEATTVLTEADIEILLSPDTRYYLSAQTLIRETERMVIGRLMAKGVL